MVHADKLAEVTALLAERDEDFRPFENAQVSLDGRPEPLWCAEDLKRLLGYGPRESLQGAIDRAKTTAATAGISLRENFIRGDALGLDGRLYLSKYAAILVTMHADPNKPGAANAQSYFALQVNRQALEDERRVRTRLAVADENKKLSGVAKTMGVTNFSRFHSAGVEALYGGLKIDEVQRLKGLGRKDHYLDFAGSEELAANLFRITQTAAALRRQPVKDGALATSTHARVAQAVRNVITEAGNLPPERLPPARQSVDRVAAEVKQRVLGASPEIPSAPTGAGAPVIDVFARDPEDMAEKS
ncbi:MAG: hypothetical protein H6713_42610 [Myxococcales bacterium]|nr:hypothetical protein [Myxococcales bacterium]